MSFCECGAGVDGRGGVGCGADWVIPICTNQRGEPTGTGESLLAIAALKISASTG
ncbi:hypothetical protein MSIMFI_05419 [Mycobacterium simulans]|nr:hypothetical protein MSIMFI_05419 [Mycobacterium simulans]